MLLYKNNVIGFNDRMEDENMAGKLENQIAIITGCSGGIGKQTAIRFAQEGAKLVICARRYEKLLETKEICEQAGAEVLALQCDVTVMDNLENLVNQAVAKFGGIDILVNNAVSANPGTDFMEQSEEYLLSIFNSGFLSTWRLMKLCFPYLKESKGRIVNFGSASGIKGTVGYSAYGAMKEAIRSLTRTVANEWGPYGITCNAICPTAIGERAKEFLETLSEEERSPKALGFTTVPAVGYIGDAYEDVTPIIVFLASKESHYLTGQSIRADGGGSLFAI